MWAACRPSKRKCLAWPPAQPKAPPAQQGFKTAACARAATPAQEPIAVNEVNVPLISRHLHGQLFPSASSPYHRRPPSRSAIDISRTHLEEHGLYSPSAPPPSAGKGPTSFDLPRLQGPTIAHHFEALGKEINAPYEALATQLAGVTLRPPPAKEALVLIQGWMMYHRDGCFEHVAYPGAELPEEERRKGQAVVFDVETLPFKQSGDFPIMAAAATKDRWYVWCSPWLTGDSTEPNHLIPLGPPRSTPPSSSSELFEATDEPPKLVVGHHVLFDRARVEDEYTLRRPATRWIDTLSLHVAVSGLTSPQRPGWLMHRKAAKAKKAAEEAEEDDESVAEAPSAKLAASKTWQEVSSMNSLEEVARLHCGIQVDKSTRNVFIDPETTIEDIRASYHDLISYCLSDVAVTHSVFKVLLPRFLKQCPHPVSFAGVLLMSQPVLPVDWRWPDYLERAEKVYATQSKGVSDALIQLADEARRKVGKLGEDGKFEWEHDFWLKQLDWAPKKAKRLPSYMMDQLAASPLPEEDAVNAAVEDVELKKPKKRTIAAAKAKPKAKIPPMSPEDLVWPKWYHDLDKVKTGLSLSVGKRAAPLLLKLRWKGYPLAFSRAHGWMFRVPKDEAADVLAENSSLTAETFQLAGDTHLREDQTGIYIRLPHPDGEGKNVGSPLSKPFVAAFDDGILTSEYPVAKQALALNASCSYWSSARERILKQMVVWDQTASKASPSPGDTTAQGLILPQVIPMGTVTRRAVEKTWLTASNAKAKRVGSELKAMIKAPEGYAIVGADVDSEELWICSVMGDAQLGIHGGTAVGWMTLEGTKSAGTDLHSKSAHILGITRDNAKVFNYSRIYGAGIKHAVQLLLKANPTMGKEKATKLAKDLYAGTKGLTYRGQAFTKTFWHGGTESFVFNKLEAVAHSSMPRTPALGCGITEALQKAFLPAQGRDKAGQAFLPSRINWVVQSSGVDYLHMLMVAMEYLTKRFAIDARYMISVHDEIRYLVKEEDKYRVAMALQVANLWVRSMFSFQLELGDLPQSCAFFSAVDIDHCFRKEVNMTCVTPSQPEPIPFGESLDIDASLESTANGSLFPDARPMSAEADLPDLPVPDNVVFTADFGSHRTSDSDYLLAQTKKSAAQVGDLWLKVDSRTRQSYSSYAKPAFPKRVAAAKKKGVPTKVKAPTKAAVMSASYDSFADLDDLDEFPEDLDELFSSDATATMRSTV